MREPTAHSPDLFEGLSSVQRSVVEWGQGPLLLLGGPGSGKTEALARRVAHLLLESPSEKFRILVFTYTKRAADAIKDRIEIWAPGRESRLFIGTFHRFAAEVLRLHGSHVGLQPNFRIYASTSDLEGILREALNEVRLQGGEIDEDDARLLPVLHRLRMALIDPSNAPSYVLDVHLRQRIASIYGAYEHCLERANALDIDGVLYHAVRLFQRYPALGKRYRTVYPYWCIDELENANSAQYALLRAMARQGFNDVVAAADPEQSIYAWNGGGPLTIERFIGDFAADIMKLPSSTHVNIDLAFIAKNLLSHVRSKSTPESPTQPVTAGGLGTDASVRVGRLSSEHEEAQVVANDIARRYEAGAGTFAVLARARGLLQLVRDNLDMLQIPSAPAQPRGGFSSAPFAWLSACLELANRRRDLRQLEVLCSAFGEMTGVRLVPDDVIAEAESTHQDFLRKWAEIIVDHEQANLAKRMAEYVLEFLVRKADYTEFVYSARSAFMQLTSSSVWHADTFPGYADDERAWVSQIEPTLGSGAPLEAFLREIRPRPEQEPSGVRLLSIHAAKGMFFDHVYVLGLAEGELPSFVASSLGERRSEIMSEERRICFVAITRALKSLTLTCSQTYGGRARNPSRFLYEMGLPNL
ncbi:ATP-dependent helicase [Polyangium sp. y55x31]|uniref:ATP-dependent helicase n=1 Tax=Polyangium sp. y55x31 TaxID=3042688 RepID=UPI0024828079|nr:ATP-dependent helicase [Polyangium sp. y55x31]MDI1480382.1 ATP-dependent helicase [Polyangium sp. y55x31]